MKHLFKFEDFGFTQHTRVNESLGVPDNITNVGDELFHLIVGELREPLKIKEGETIFEFDGPFVIGNVYFQKAIVVFEIDIINSDSLKKTGGVSFGDAFGFDQDRAGKEIEKNVFSNLFILIELQTHTSVLIEDVKKIFIRNEFQIVPVIVHELKHNFDYTKSIKKNYLKNLKKFYFGYKPNLKIAKDRLKISGNALQDDPVIQFFYYLYFVNRIEYLVRPSQFYSELLKNEVNKKDFTKFIESNPLVKQLKVIRDFDFQKYYELLVDKFKKDPNYGAKKIPTNFPKLDTGLDDDQIRKYVDEFLSQMFKKIKLESLANFGKKILGDHFNWEYLLGPIELDPSEPQEIQNLKQNMEDFKRELEKMYKGDWKNFYEKGTEMIKREAEKNLRKIYKLYDLAK